MDLNLHLKSCITAIQKEQCLNCRFGKAIMALDGMVDAAEVTDEPKASAQPAAVVDASASKADKKREYQPVSEPQATSKRCPKCDTVKPMEEFSLSKSSKDGRASYCKACKCEYMAQHRHPEIPAPASSSLNVAAPKDPNKPHVCDKCGKAFMALGSLIVHRRDNCPARIGAA